MPYGPEKYAAPILARNITDVIADHLARFSAFNNTSVCYFGARLKYRIEIELFSRGNTREIVEKETTVGANPTLEEETDPALEISAERVVVDGDKSAGRVPKLVPPPSAPVGDAKPAPVGQRGKPAGRLQPPPRPAAAAHAGTGEAVGDSAPVTG
jgi:hypothetical protein